MLNHHDHHEKVRRAFDLAAENYDQFASLQYAVGKKLLAHLPHIFYEKILDLGCGNGVVSHQLFLSSRFNHMILLDISYSCLELAHLLITSSSPRKWGSINLSRDSRFRGNDNDGCRNDKAECENDNDECKNNIAFLQGNFDFLPCKDHVFQLIFSNMSLQWSQDFSSTLRRIFSLLTPGGHLVFSLPLAGTFAELTPHFAVNSFITLGEIKKILQQISHKILFAEQEKFVRHFVTTHDLLHSIKGVGANYVANRKVKSLRGKNFLRDLDINQLTYEIGYVVVKK